LETFFDKMNQPKEKEHSTKPNGKIVNGLEIKNQKIRNLAVTELSLIYNNLVSLELSGNLLQTFPEILCERLIWLRLLDLSDNSLIELPASIGNLSHLEKLFLQNNLLQVLPADIGRLFRLEELNVQQNPLIYPPPHIVSLGFETLFAYLRDNMQPLPRPPERQFILNPSFSLPLNQNENMIRVLTYNILAECYTNEEFFYYCPSWALSWDRRRDMILEEILKYDCDIICLQEVEMGQYTQFFEPELQKHGYEGRFAPKSRARTMNDWTVDGCATFFKNLRFTVSFNHVTEFQSKSLYKNKEYGSEAYTRIVQKDNIALITVFQLHTSESNNFVRKKPPKQFLVANTHIQWNPEFCDVKLIQVQLLLEELEEVSSKFGTLPLIIAGDLNSTVDSGPYKLLKEGRIPPNHPDLNSLDYGSSSLNGINHNFKLDSSYAAILNHEPPFTNYTAKFQGVLDYLWYTTDSISVVRIVEPLDEKYVQQTCLPNPHFPSDHIFLVSDFFLH
jgi:CCR4-NOT transcription complex subunit 6